MLEGRPVLKALGYAIVFFVLAAIPVVAVTRPSMILFLFAYLLAVGVCGRIFHTLYFGPGIPLAEWTLTFLVGAFTAALIVALYPEGAAAAGDRQALVAGTVALSFLCAFAGSAFGWYYIRETGVKYARLRYGWLALGWLIVIPILVLLIYHLVSAGR